MPTYKTAKKARKWWKAYLRISTTASTRHLQIGCKFRRTFVKRSQIYRNFEKWRDVNDVACYSFGRPAHCFFDKKQRCKIFEYLD